MRPGLKVLFITGYAENAVLSHGHIEHGMEVLTKPFAIDDLITRVNRALRDSEDQVNVETSDVSCGWEAARSAIAPRTVAREAARRRACAAPV